MRGFEVLFRLFVILRVLNARSNASVDSRHWHIQFVRQNGAQERVGRTQMAKANAPMDTNSRLRLLIQVCESAGIIIQAQGHARDCIIGRVNRLLRRYLVALLLRKRREDRSVNDSTSSTP